MISYVAGTPVSSRGVSFRQGWRYIQRDISAASGDHDPPEPEWEGCPLVFRENVAESIFTLWGHLTFDPDTGVISHVAPSVVSFCSALYAAVHKDADPQKFFSGSVPQAAEHGCAYTVFASRVKKRKRHHNVICMYSEHNPAKPRQAISDPSYSTSIYNRYLCDDCINRLYFRHRPPTALEVGTGYLAIGPLKARASADLWQDALSWLERFNEPKLFAILYGVTFTEAIAFMMRPVSFSASGFVPNCGPLKRVATIVARRHLTLDCNTELAIVKRFLTPPKNKLTVYWRQGYMNAGTLHRNKVLKGISKTNTFYYLGKNDANSDFFLVETDAYDVLSALVAAQSPLIEVCIANRRTGVGIDCSAEYCLSATALDCAEWAGWSHFRRLLEQKQSAERPARVAGNLRRSLNGAAFGPFAALVELAVNPDVVSVVLSKDSRYLAQESLAEGALAQIMLEQRFLENPVALPDYGEPTFPERILVSDILELVMERVQCA